MHHKDLVLKKWVEKNIHSLDENRVKALIHVLDQDLTLEGDPNSVNWHKRWKF
ncbi:hypothetical protein AAZX31_17G179100 [Glycine max]